MQSAAVGSPAPSLGAAVRQCWRAGKGIGGFYQGYGGACLRVFVGLVVLVGWWMVWGGWMCDEWVDGRMDGGM